MYVFAPAGRPIRRHSPRQSSARNRTARARLVSFPDQAPDDNHARLLVARLDAPTPMPARHRRRMAPLVVRCGPRD